MSRSLMLIVLAVLIILAPFSGLPMSILTWILPVLGFVLLAIGISYKRTGVSKSSVEPIHEAPSESLA